ncbi:hypothetical protein ABVK25_009356 [Lepraria finkii]|uniref:Uncharacterized protein n=1 Tax=Lepraria finkii TaxID=1340010 RepID=A0ABR4AXK0_9LECA
MSSSEGMSVLDLVSAGIKARNWGRITLSKSCFCILFIVSATFKAFASSSDLISSTSIVYQRTTPWPLQLPTVEKPFCRQPSFNTVVSLISSARAGVELPPFGIGKLFCPMHRLN